MKLKIVSKISTIFILLILILMNFFGVNFSASTEHVRSREYQPYNSFKEYIWGGVGNQENEKYGWNITYIESLNGDNYKDLIVGNPWHDENTFTDIGAVHIFFGKANTGFDNINISGADVTIIGDAIGDNFGWDVADAGDTNNDGYNDLIVGAPGVKNGRGRAYIFYGGTFQSGSYNAIDIVDRILDSEKIGVTENGNFGSSVSGIGDFNNDDYDDVIVGAPGSDQIVITYGYKNKVTIKPNLWDDNLSTPGIVDFSKGVHNYVNETYEDNNTWGLNGEDDGWDWIDSFQDPDNLYGQTSPAPYDHANVYAPWEPDGPDADGLTFDNQSALEIMIGRNHTHLNPYINSSGWDAGASAAWGIEFNLTPEMSTQILSNSTIELAFDYKFIDTNKLFQNTNNTRVLCMIKSRIWNSSDNKIDLGDFEIGNEKYVIYRPADPWGSNAWGPIYGHFEADISDYLDHAGAYYWDFGCYLDRYMFYEDDGIAAFFDNITMEINNDRVVVIEGMKNSGFGSAISALGDINSDGYLDAMIGAPNLAGGYAVLLHGKKRFKSIESISSANIILTGKNPGDKFGYSIASMGDVDNDGIPDVLIGAPGGNYAHLYYGSSLTIPSLVPDLWENNEESDTPQIEFDSGIKTTGNTPGLAGADDGWDTWNGVYGYESGESPGSSVMYNGANNIDSDQIAIDNELIIAIGGGLGGGTTQGAKPDSGAYGTKFTVSQGMIDTIENGGEAIISFDWTFGNSGLDQDDTIWIKSFMRNSSDNLELGWNLDEHTVNNNNKDETNEIYWAENPESTNDVFVQDCSECFSTAGSYYFDVGAKVGDFYWESGLWEDGLFHFDNIHLRFNPQPYTIFTGPEQSGFGFSVGFGNKLNIDDYDDIIIGAPYYDSPNGNDSGAVFGFLSDPTSKKQWLAENAEFVTYGENVGDNFGWTLLGTKSLNSDDFGEIISSAIHYDSSEENAGKIYILSITKIPRIRLLYPLGGELLSGNVVINATVTDPDENIDTVNGVFFYYKTSDQILWQLLGNDPTPETEDNFYEYHWDTTTLPDGSNYYIRSTVQDQELNFGENISLAVTIDNPHPPTITIQDPKVGEIVQHTLEIRALAKDSNLDLIGGGINTTQGVQFYFSADKTTWELLSSEDSGVNNVYTIELNTTPYQDGEYWLEVNATDWDGFEVVDTIKVNIDNPSRPPSIKLISPLDGQELIDKVNIRATAFDFDGDINSSGITFMIASYLEPNNWQLIGNSTKYVINSTGAHVYSFKWDTTIQSDGWYQLKCLVNDSTGLNNETDGIEVKIHNKENNPPFIQLISPQGGKILDISHPLSGRVRDLEDNIDANGVTYYYSKDKVKWGFIGTEANPLPTDKEYYNFLWSTDTVPDGEYWLNVSVTDITQLTSWDVIDEPIIIHNRITNPPIARFITPVAGQFINGSFKIQVYAYDLEDKSENLEVALSYTTNLKFEDWINLATLTTPKKGEKIFEFTWDTDNFDDGKYWLKTVAKDLNNMEGEAISDYFYIHNSIDNPPLVEFLGPHSGEVKGTIKLNATVFDLEDNLDENGVYFEYSTDNKTWTLMGNDPLGRSEGMEIIYDLIWDTTQVSDNIYWFRARARDDTGQEGTDISRGQIIIHNNQNNPPILTLIEPTKGYELMERQLIQVKVLDFEDDIDTVSFYYSKDNSSWTPIESNININEVGIYYYYSTMWNTEGLNGDFYINVRAVDEGGRKAQIIEGPFKKGEVVKDGGGKKEAQDLTVWIILIIIVIIMVMLFVLLMRRSKKREEEIIEEVAAEAQRSQLLEGEIISTPSMAGATETTDVLQTYIPPQESLAPEPTTAAPQLPAHEAHEPEPDVETIESYMNQLNTWKAEGYNVSRLEQLSVTDEEMFAKTFPIFSSNITRLKKISERIKTMDPTGYEEEIDSINSKLYEPDQALVTEREFNELEKSIILTQPDMGIQPEGIDDIDLPPDIDLPLDIDLPPEPEQGSTEESKSKSNENEKLED